LFPNPVEWDFCLYEKISNMNCRILGIELTDTPEEVLGEGQRGTSLGAETF